MPPKRTRGDVSTATEEPVPKRTIWNTRSTKRTAREQQQQEPALINPKIKAPSKRNNTKTPTEPKPAVATAATTTEVTAETSSGPSYWLMKAEPETRIEKGKDVKFSIDDLAACKEPAPWDGVRNYGARNNLKAMKKGDLAFFYHSNCKEPGIVGIMEVVREASIDETAFDPKEPYHDPKSSRLDPKWYLVHVEFRRKLSRQIGLAELKTHTNKATGAGGELSEMPLLKMGRLSVSAVPRGCWDFILELEKKKRDN